jgi:phosphotransferase system  glucose/maltose/N-acetylglucosamine-specific IIC component
MIDEVSVFIIAPAMIMGIFGVVVASRLLDRKERRKITTSELA